MLLLSKSNKFAISSGNSIPPPLKKMMRNRHGSNRTHKNDGTIKFSRREGRVYLLGAKSVTLNRFCFFLFSFLSVYSVSAIPKHRLMVASIDDLKTVNTKEPTKSRKMHRPKRVAATPSPPSNPRKNRVRRPVKLSKFDAASHDLDEIRQLLNLSSNQICEKSSQGKRFEKFTSESETMPSQDPIKPVPSGNENGTGEINRTSDNENDSRELNRISPDRKNMAVIDRHSWKPYTCPSQTSDWLENYEAIKQFHTSFGHFLVPPDWEGKPGLAEWAAHERQMHREMRQGYRDGNSEEHHRWNMLQQINFPMELQRKLRSRSSSRQPVRCGDILLV